MVRPREELNNWAVEEMDRQVGIPCMCIYVFLCVHGHMDACVHLCVQEPEIKLRCHSSAAAHLGFWDKISHRDLGPGWWASKLERSCLCVPSLRIQVCTFVPGFFHGLWPSKSGPYVLSQWTVYWLGCLFIGSQGLNPCVSGRAFPSTVSFKNSGIA